MRYCLNESHTCFQAKKIFDWVYFSFLNCDEGKTDQQMKYLTVTCMFCSFLGYQEINILKLIFRYLKYSYFLHWFSLIQNFNYRQQGYKWFEKTRDLLWSIVYFRSSWHWFLWEMSRTSLKIHFSFPHIKH